MKRMFAVVLAVMLALAAYSPTAEAGGSGLIVRQVLVNPTTGYEYLLDGNPVPVIDGQSTWGIAPQVLNFGESAVQNVSLTGDSELFDMGAALPGGVVINTRAVRQIYTPLVPGAKYTSSIVLRVAGVPVYTSTVVFQASPGDLVQRLWFPLVGGG